jgi:hypothetical protein
MSNITLIIQESDNIQQFVNFCIIFPTYSTEKSRITNIVIQEYVMFNANFNNISVTPWWRKPELYYVQCNHSNQTIV